jgi:N-acetylglucosaminyl-diphospho-decaprenol L-rhamnosyltransferase
MPDLTVVIVNRNGRSVLPSCLESLRAASWGRDWPVILVDNASTDGSLGLVAQTFPEVRLLRNEDNLGFSRANNLAWRQSPTPFILFLNPDTTIIDGAIDILLKEMQGRDDSGMCGPLLIRVDGSFQVSFGPRVTFFREFVQKSFLNAWNRRRLGRLRKAKEVAWVSAACCLARREALESVGGFDEGFFLYFEDIDLCARMAERGWRTLFVPLAKVFHQGGTATREFSPSRFEYRRSQLRFYDRHNSAVSGGLLRTYLRLSFALIGLRRRFKGGRGEDARRFWDLLTRRKEQP